MSRAEILAHLRSIDISAQITILPSEYALECEYITPSGYKSEWIGIDDWPAYQISIDDTAFLRSIKEKIENETLQISDLTATALEKLAKEYCSQQNTETLCHLLHNLIDFNLCDSSSDDEKIIYALYRQSNKQVFFFENLESLKSEFSKEYLNDVISWDNLSTEDLVLWIHRLKNEFQSFPTISFD